MNEDRDFTLAELAGETGLTERTVRYYIEQVLPPHHKQGRGKLARYGSDTLNCIRFILLVGERYGFKPGQAKGVLAGIGQATVDRVVRGEEELAVMTVPLDAPAMKLSSATNLPRASARQDKYKIAEQRSPAREASLLSPMDLLIDEELSSKAPTQVFEASAGFAGRKVQDPWQTIYSSGPVRIQYRGQQPPNAHQRAQIEAAARLIELVMK